MKEKRNWKIWIEEKIQGQEGNCGFFETTSMGLIEALQRGEISEEVFQIVTEVLRAKHLPNCPIIE